MKAVSSNHARMDSTDRAISRILDQHMKGGGPNSSSSTPVHHNNATAAAAAAVNGNNEESKKENDQKVMNINLHHERNSSMGTTQPTSGISATMPIGIHAAGPNDTHSSNLQMNSSSGVGGGGNMNSNVHSYYMTEESQSQH